ncbi:MAG TPA: RidA family protein [Rhodobacteraceae bacterium]|nr:RidA family protein [Paracoccaceae bacterium]
MAKRAIIPPGYHLAAEALKLSPGLISGNHLFLSGVTGAGADGIMPDDPATQFRQAFEKIGLVLTEAGLDFGAIAEMTTYHVGLREHFELFSSVRAEFVRNPYPAWTAIEAAALRRERALVEIRVIADMTSST